MLYYELTDEAQSPLNKTNNKVYSISLRDVKHAPNAPNNLISIGRLTDNGHSAIFTTTSVIFKSKNNEIFAEGRKIGRMYQMRAWIKITGTSRDFAATAKGRTLDKWHRILGHVNIWTVKTILKNSLVTGLSIDDKSQELTHCIACISKKTLVLYLNIYTTMS